MKLKKQLVYLLILIIGFFVGSLISNIEYSLFNISQLNKSDIEKYESNSEKLNHILQSINKNYVDSINYTKFENEVINTILTKLDPHSSYISVDNFKAAKVIGMWTM